jgi:hypothetical protein
MLEFAMIRPTTPDDRTALMAIAEAIGFQPKEVEELSEMLADYFSGDSESSTRNAATRRRRAFATSTRRAMIKSCSAKC